MKNLLSISIFILFSFVCKSQTFTNYTTADGLIDNSVNCVFVDYNDVVWFGTQNGLSSFDGTIWNSYSTAHPRTCSQLWTQRASWRAGRRARRWTLARPIRRLAWFLRGFNVHFMTSSIEIGCNSGATQRCFFDVF